MQVKGESPTRPHWLFGSKDQVKRTATGYQVHVDNLPSSGGGITCLLTDDQYLQGKNNQGHCALRQMRQFLNKKERISKSLKKTTGLHFFYVILPLVILSFVLIGIFCYLIVLYNFRTPSFPRDARLYEAPQIYFAGLN